MWISFHPQLVGDDSPEIIADLKQLIGSLEFSVLSTTHDFDWARSASILLPMAAWSEEKGTFTNYAGRVQVTNRAVMPPGDAQPLHVYMSELLKLSGIEAASNPSVIFEWISSEVPAYTGMSYDAIGLLGQASVQTPEEVLR